MKYKIMNNDVRQILVMIFSDLWIKVGQKDHLITTEKSKEGLFVRISEPKNDK